MPGSVSDRMVVQITRGHSASSIVRRRAVAFIKAASVFAMGLIVAAGIIWDSLREYLLHAPLSRREYDEIAMAIIVIYSFGHLSAFFMSKIRFDFEADTDLDVNRDSQTFGK